MNDFAVLNYKNKYSILIRSVTHQKRGKGKKLELLMAPLFFLIVELAHQSTVVFVFLSISQKLRKC